MITPAFQGKKRGHEALLLLLEWLFTHGKCLFDTGSNWALTNLNFSFQAIEESQQSLMNVISYIESFSWDVYSKSKWF